MVPRKPRTQQELGPRDTDQSDKDEDRDATIGLKNVVGNSLKRFLQRGMKTWDEI